MSERASQEALEFAKLQRFVTEEAKLPSGAAFKLQEISERPQDVRALRLKRTVNDRFILEVLSTSSHRILNGQAFLTEGRGFLAFEVVSQFLERCGAVFETIIDLEATP